MWDQCADVDEECSISHLSLLEHRTQETPNSDTNRTPRRILQGPGTKPGHVGFYVVVVPACRPKVEVSLRRIKSPQITLVLLLTCLPLFSYID